MQRSMSELTSEGDPPSTGPDIRMWFHSLFPHRYDSLPKIYSTLRWKGRVKVPACLVLFKYLYYNYTDKNNVQQLNVPGSLHLITSLSLHSAKWSSARHTAQTCFIEYKTWKWKKTQQHIYSDIHEFNPSLWTHNETRPLSFQHRIFWDQMKLSYYHHDTSLLGIKWVIHGGVTVWLAWRIPNEVCFYLL